jgi:hypothetical protein
MTSELTDEEIEKIQSIDGNITLEISSFEFPFSYFPLPSLFG